jgi:hypothetical protein
MLMRVAMALAAAALILPAPGTAQRTPRPRPPVNCYPFACPPRPAPGKLPGEEALALGRRIVAIVDGGAVAKRTGELVALPQAKEPRRPPLATYPNGPIRAVPPVDLANYPAWAFVVQQRVIDHAALFYATRYSLDELRAMALFFESTAGAKLVQERQSRSAELEHALATRVLEDDLWNVVCGTPVPQEVEDAPHHEFHRLHPPVDFPLPPRPLWCGTERGGDDG